MKFLVQDDIRNLYYLKCLKKWQDLWILQEPGGNYDVINESNRRSWLEFPYKRVKIIGKKYLLAFWKNEIEQGTYFHVYDENGRIPEIIGKNYEVMRRYIIINTIDGKELKKYFK